ncbi:MAG: hypothetical protein H0T18_07020 [Chloroflexia bacterium]|nr:hypothetical protein [Chloroflexia bacterium]
MPSNRQQKRILWLGGLMVVLALLLHDALMASSADTAPVVQTAISLHQHASVHQAIGIGGDHSGDDHAPAHPRDCGTTGTAVPSTGNQLDNSDLELPAIFTPGNLCASTHAAASCWSEPFWPPCTLQALFQVYRI